MSRLSRLEREAEKVDEDDAKAIVGSGVSASDEMLTGRQNWVVSEVNVVKAFCSSADAGPCQWTVSRDGLSPFTCNSRLHLEESEGGGRGVC